MAVRDPMVGAGMSIRATRAVGLLGVASFVLILVGAFVSPPLWDTPGINTSSTHLAMYLYANHERTIASLFIYSLAMGLFLSFAAGLWSWLRQSEQAPQMLSAIFAFGAIGLSVLIFAGFAVAAVMSYRPQPPALAVSLTDMTFGLLALSGIPTALCLAAYAILVFRHRCLPAWTGWLAFIALDAHILIAASFLGHGNLFSPEGAVIVAVPATLFAWILASSVVLLRTTTGVSHERPSAATHTVLSRCPRWR